jgi:hypothetical protein
MQAALKIGLAASALLACNIAFAQSTPTQAAQPGQVIAQAAPAPVGAGGVAAGTAGTVTVPAVGAISTTALAVGAVAVVAGVAVAASVNDNTTPNTPPAGTH